VAEVSDSVHVYVVLSGGPLTVDDGETEPDLIPVHSSVTIGTRCVLSAEGPQSVPTLLFFTRYDAPVAPVPLELRKRQKAYVQRVRDSFIDAERAVFRLIDFCSEKHKVDQYYTQRTLEIWVEENILVEPMARSLIEKNETIAFKELQKSRHRDRLAPWCTLSCNFCCQTKDAWELQVYKLYNEQQHALSHVVATFHEDLLLVFEEEMHVIHLLKNLNEELLRQHETERRMAFSLESSARSVVSQEEIFALVVIKERLDLFSVAARSSAVMAELGHKEYNVHRTNLDITLREAKLQKRQVELVEGEENVGRQRLSTQDDIWWSSWKTKLANLSTRILLKEQEAAFAGILSERNSLRNEKAVEDKARAEAAEKAALRAQAELIEEFEFLKKLKKGKTENLAPVCDKCEGSYTDALLHRMNECPKRPGECKLCKKIFFAVDLQFHQETTCPQRPVECEMCHNFYRAFYIEEHKQNCGMLAEATALLTKCTPEVSIGVGDDLRDGGVVIKTVTPGSEMERKGVVPGDALLAVGGSTTTTRKAVESIFQTLTVGAVMEICIVSSDGTRFGLTWVVQTATCSLERFKQCTALTQKDQQHQTKPPPKKKKPAPAAPKK